MNSGNLTNMNIKTRNNMRTNNTASGLQYNPGVRETSRGELRKKGKTVNDASWKNLKGISN